MKTELPAGRLPVRDLEEDIVQAFQRLRRVIITAPPGSGKSTQVPQILRDRGLCGSGTVLIAEPRRLAARLLALRVAAERADVFRLHPEALRGQYRRAP